MGFRFRKRLRIFPGLWLNLSKKGGSLSVGSRGDRGAARDSGLSYKKPGAGSLVSLPGLPQRRTGPLRSLTAYPGPATIRRSAFEGELSAIPSARERNH
jgi:hypothetical protein